VQGYKGTKDKTVILLNIWGLFLNTFVPMHLLTFIP